MKIIIIFLSGYFLNMFYITVLYHRAFAHGAITVKPYFIRFFEKTAIWITGIDPLSWILMHRMHHKHSDTTADPHSPLNGGIFSVFYSQYKSYRYYLERLRLKDDPKLNSLINDVPLKVSQIDSNLPYLLHILISILIIFISRNWLMGIAYFAGIMSHPVQGWLINSIAHYYGHRNFNTNDNSKNNLLLAYLVFGEGLQNNHHAHPERANFAHKFPEIDPGYLICKIGARLGILKL